MPERAGHEAARWLVALQAEGASEATREAWRQWRAADPEHERAWQRIESFGAALRELQSPLAHGTLVREGPRLSRGRRRVVKTLALVAVAGGGAWLLRDTTAWRADYQTQAGQRRTLTLADGSSIVLGTASAIAVAFGPDERRVTLLRGEILVTTAPDPEPGAHAGSGRPFVVHTPEGRLRALGTRFSVRQEAARSLLSVFDGAVEIRPADAGSAAVVIPAGSRASFTRHGVGQPEPLAAGELAFWTTGMLVAHGMPLAELVAELARHRRGYLRCDPAIGGLPVSGVYPVADTDAVLDMLQRSLPVEVRRYTRYWVNVVPRSPSAKKMGET